MTVPAEIPIIAPKMAANLLIESETQVLHFLVTILSSETPQNLSFIFKVSINPFSTVILMLALLLLNGNIPVLMGTNILSTYAIGSF